VTRKPIANAEVSARQPGWSKTDFDVKLALKVILVLGCPPTHWGRGLGVPPLQKNFQFWGLKRRILVHSVALLSAEVSAAFCTVIYSADAISTHYDS